ncbi:hypothetical protein GWI33_022669 [Rhynchophorus ferrugineus]|uniref:Uncharacterized protein n=1 Tax=Rhynchophorus ferrugineus TaxID=354439 RepID=A0A834IUA6_RHYFE|nr:hypothetical protein GWI33_022669 [Rhynchophorus ferrugineus]
MNHKFFAFIPFSFSDRNRTSFPVSLPPYTPSVYSTSPHLATPQLPAKPVPLRLTAPTPQAPPFPGRSFSQLRFDFHLVRLAVNACLLF